MSDAAPVERNGIQRLVGETLMVHKGDDECIVPSAVALKDAELVCFYFSASWCKPCQKFTPVLAGFYNKVGSSGKVAIIFVSSDKDPDSFRKYYKTMPWFAIPPDQPTIRHGLAKHFNVTGIPRLVVVDSKTGDLVTGDGRLDIAAMISDATETVAAKDSKAAMESKTAAESKTATPEVKKDTPEETAQKVQDIIKEWKAKDAHPVDDTNVDQDTSAWSRIVYYLMQNPPFIFILIFLARKIMSFLAQKAGAQQTPDIPYPTDNTATEAEQEF